MVNLSLGFACATLLFTFHANQARIYRIYTELHNHNLTHSTGVLNPMGEPFQTGYQVADKVGSPSRTSGWLLCSRQKFEKDVAFVDPDFLVIFHFPRHWRNPRTALQDRSVAHQI
ncbi:hypothetical protein [Spirosoma koreense]